MIDIDKLLDRNKNLIKKLIFELQIKETYEYLVSDDVNSIYVSNEKEKAFEDLDTFIGRSRLLIKCVDKDKKKRKAIKNLTFAINSDRYDELIESKVKIEVLAKLFREQKLLKELLILENEINQHCLINTY